MLIINGFEMKKSDIILLLSIIFISIVLILCFFIVSIKNSANTVTVTVNGEKVAEFPLDKDIEYLITNGDGGENLLIIKDGKAYIKEASCPDKVCVRSGVAEELKPVTCLPNKVIVSIS